VIWRDNRGVNAVDPPLKLPHLTALSRVLRRGSLGDQIDGRSREGRFLRDVERELLAPLGAQPSFGQRLLARRAARLAVRLELFDEKAAQGKDWSAHDLRTYHALQNGLRLLVRELGLKAVAVNSKLPSLDDIVAGKVQR
jgi:hypothetical protein